MLPFPTHFFCDGSVLLGCLKPLLQLLPLINAVGQKEFCLFPPELHKLWQWHGQCWVRSVLVGLQLTAPADPGAGTATARANCSRLPWECVIAFVTLAACLEGFDSKARPKDCPETSSPADIFLLHQFSNWPLLDFSRLPDYIQCRNTNE